MEELKVKFLMGPAECNDKYIPEYSRQFLSELEKVLGMKVSCAEIEEVKTQPLPVYLSHQAEQNRDLKNCILRQKNHISF